MKKKSLVCSAVVKGLDGHKKDPGPKVHSTIEDFEAVILSAKPI